MTKYFSRSKHDQSPGLSSIAIHAAVVGLIAALIYLPSVHGAFVWDDDEYILGNPYIRSMGADFFRWAFGEFYASNWHPLIWLSLALDYRLWGLDPAGYHITNMVLHGLNTACVYLLSYALISAASQRSSSSSDIAARLTGTAAVTTAVLFGIHPLHVESVAWITERKDVLSALFFLLSSLCYHCYVDSLKKSKSRGPVHIRILHRHYILLLIFFVLALLSKPMAVTLPVVLLVLDWYPYERIKDLRSFFDAAAEKSPLIVLSAASSYITVLAQKVGELGSDLAQYPVNDRILVAFKSLVGYLGHLALPVRLSPYYSYPYYNTVKLFSGEYFVPVCIAIVISIFCIWHAKTNKIFAAAWLGYMVLLAPVIGIVQVGLQEMADRYMYLPSIPPFIITGIALSKLRSRIFMNARAYTGKFLFASALLCVACSMLLLTLRQIPVWSNAETLWNRALEIEPHKSVIGYNNRGAYYLKTGRYQDAARDFTAAIYLNLQGGIKPAAKLYHNRARSLTMLGRHDDALVDLQKAFDAGLSPDKYFNFRAVIFFSQARYADAVTDLSEAVRLKKDAPETYNLRGLSYLKLGRYQEATEDFSAAIRLGPSPSYEYHLNRGIALARLDRFEDALSDYDTAIRIKNEPDAFYNRGNLFALRGMYAEAERDFSHAISLSSRPNPDYLANLAFVRKKRSEGKK